MQHYRALFDDLLDVGSDEPLSRDGAAPREREPAPRS